MNYSFDEKKLMPKFKIIEEKDIADAFEIERMMQTRGWKILEKHFEQGIAQIEDYGMGLVLDVDKEKNGIKAWAILKAWRDASNHASALVTRAKTYLETKKQNDDFNQQTLNIGGELA
jgi:hypothetical protein